MHRAHHTFSVLQATAAIATLSIILWSFRLPSLRFAEAANVTSFSDTLSDSAPSVVSNHTISFVTPTGMAAGQTITITFPSGFGDISSLAHTDLDLAINGTDATLVAGSGVGASWGISVLGDVISIDSGTAAIGSGATVTVEIGTNATFGASGANQIINPGGTTSYEIDLVVGSSDTGSTRVAIIDEVTVTASVDTIFSFTVAGVTGGQTVNTSETTTGSTSATAIPFGVLLADTASTAAQDLEVSTNASNGFVVTVVADQQLLSSNGADIDGFRNGSFDATPVAWESPSAGLGQEQEYGHWGITSDDDSLTGILSDIFNVGAGGDRFVSASTTPVEVFRHNGPTDGTSQGIGTTRVGYKVEITALQEAADDYTATLTYVATPVF